MYGPQGYQEIGPKSQRAELVRASREGNEEVRALQQVVFCRGRGGTGTGTIFPIFPESYWRLPIRSLNRKHRAVTVFCGFVKGDGHMDALPVSVGDGQLQKNFIANHEGFLREFPEIKALTDKMFTLVLEKYNAELLSGAKNHDETTLRLAQLIVLYLCRTAFDAFGDLLILAGNGKGFAARMMLRVMYEHLVTAAFISQNPSEARRFDENAGLQKGKIWNRAVELIPQVKSALAPEQIQKVEESFENAKAQLKAETCKKCNQPITQEAWTRASVEEMARRADAATGLRLANLYTTCFLVPTFFIHPTAFGLESRSGRVDDGMVFREISEHEAHDATMRGHGLVLRLLKHLNSYFNLGLDTQLDARWNAFPQIWNGALPDPPTIPDKGGGKGVSGERVSVLGTWKSIAPISASFGAGFAFLLAVIIGVVFWHNSRPRAWKKDAIKAHFASIGLTSGLDHLPMVFEYDLENKTDGNYRIGDGSGLTVMATLAQSNAFSEDFGQSQPSNATVSGPSFIPPHAVGRIRVRVVYDYPSDFTKNDRSNMDKVAKFVGGELKGISGFVLFDTTNHFRIDLPSGWQDIPK